MNTSMVFALELARDKAQYNEEKGEFVRLVKQIRCKLLRGKSIDDIADALEEKNSFIQSIVDIIRVNPNLTDIEVAKQYL